MPAAWGALGQRLQPCADSRGAHRQVGGWTTAAACRAGSYIGRMEFVLFTKEAPLAAENFRALCTCEKGTVPEGHKGAGKQYCFKVRRSDVAGRIVRISHDVCAFALLTWGPCSMRRRCSGDAAATVTGAQPHMLRPRPRALTLFA